MLNPIGDLLGAEPAHVVPCHKLAATYPRYSDDLDRTRGGLDPVGRGTVSDCDPGLGEGAVDFERGGAALDVRRVVISDQQERGDSGFRQPDYPLGELSLVSLGWVAAAVGVAAEEGQVHLGFDRAVDQFVERIEKVLESSGQAGSGVCAGVVLDAYVDVGIVKDSHVGSGLLSEPYRW